MRQRKLNRLMKQLKINKKSIFNYAAQIIILLVVIKYFYDMINPIIKVAQYSHPTMDDYWMTTYVHEQWQQNHSILGFIAAALKYTIGIYKTWDGNFLSMFITSMSPNVFGDYAYPFTFYFMFVTFCIGSLTAMYAILYKRFRMPIINCVSMTLMFVAFFMNYLVDAGEALYWWPGVANYTFFFAMFMFAHAIFALYWESHKKVFLVIAGIFMFLVGLGNPFTSLVSACLCAYEVAFTIYEKKTAKTFNWIPFVCAVAGLIIVIAAPGNQNRMPVGHLSVFETIKASFVEGAIMMRAITKPSMYFYYAMTAVISFWSFYGCSDKNERSFKLPLLVSVLLICLCYASFSPTKYTQSAYYGRVLDTNFFVMMSMFTIVIMYLCAWLALWIKSRFNRDIVNYIVGFIALCTVVFSVRTLKKPYYLNSSVASMAAGALQFGTVQEFGRILDERYEELTNSPYWDVYITRTPYVPMFYHDDDSSRQAIADYYRKNVIIRE